MKNNNIRKAFYAILPLLIIGITLGYTSFPIALLCLVGMLGCTTRHTIGFFLVTYGGPLGGCIRTMYPSLPIYGLLLQLIGFILLWDVIGGLLKKNTSAIAYLFVTLAIFGIFYLLGPRNGRSVLYPVAGINLPIFFCNRSLCHATWSIL